jgi:hypothetical protein
MQPRYACLFLPETSCERSNRFLDRLRWWTFGSPGINFVDERQRRC